MQSNKILRNLSYFNHTGGHPQMNRAYMGFIKGLGMGIAVGCAIGWSGNCYMKQHKRGLKRGVSKALRGVGDLVDNVTAMF